MGDPVIIKSVENWIFFDFLEPSAFIVIFLSISVFWGE